MIVAPVARVAAGMNEIMIGTGKLPETRSLVAIVNVNSEISVKILSFHIAVGFKRPLTVVGRLMSDKLPLPAWPRAFLPQHNMIPSELVAHE
jgi:hypothetical protein